MGRSVTFVIEDGMRTRVRIAENLDGTLSFEIESLGGGRIRDLDALFFDLNDLAVGGAFSVYGDCGVLDCPVTVEGVDMLGRDTRISGTVVNDLGDFDIGIQFETARAGCHDARATGFTLAHAAAALSLDMIDLADFGLRHTAARASGTGRIEAGNGKNPTSSGVGKDVLEVVDPHVASVSLLANDARGGVVAVIDVNSAAGGWQGAM